MSSLSLHLPVSWHPSLSLSDASSPAMKKGRRLRLGRQWWQGGQGWACAIYGCLLFSSHELLKKSSVSAGMPSLASSCLLPLWAFSRFRHVLYAAFSPPHPSLTSPSLFSILSYVSHHKYNISKMGMAGKGRQLTAAAEKACISLSGQENIS